MDTASIATWQGYNQGLSNVVSHIFLLLLQDLIALSRQDQRRTPNKTMEYQYGGLKAYTMFTLEATFSNAKITEFFGLGGTLSHSQINPKIGKDDIFFQFEIFWTQIIELSLSLEYPKTFVGPVLERRKEMHCELLRHFMKKNIKKLHQITIVLAHAHEISTQRNLLEKVFT